MSFVLIGILLILAVAGLIAYFPTFAKIVGIVNTAGIFLLIVLLGLSMIGSNFLAFIK